MNGRTLRRSVVASCLFVGATAGLVYAGAPGKGPLPGARCGCYHFSSPTAAIFAINAETECCIRRMIAADQQGASEGELRSIATECISTVGCIAGSQRPGGGFTRSNGSYSIEIQLWLPVLRAWKAGVADIEQIRDELINN